MRHNVDKETLTIYLEGELNSSSSEEVEKEIDKIMSENSFKKIVLDLRDLRYISSAGLRIIVRIKQQHDDLALVNTPKPVYDIFEMVGFQKLVKVERL